jgi:hypothetical protein
MALTSILMSIFIASFVIKNIIEFTVTDNSIRKVLTPIFIFITFGVQLGIVMSESYSNCGKIQISDTLIYGLGYWILIFGSIYLLITMLPGWKQPFSNFFGYGIVSLMGIKTLFNDIMKPTNNVKGDPKLSAVIEQIYDDKSLLINTLTPGNFDNAITSLKGIFRPEVIKVINEMPYSSSQIDALPQERKIAYDNLQKLSHLVSLKDLISTNIWLLFAGILSLTYASMLTSSAKCSLSSSQLKTHITNYQKELENKEKENTHYQNNKQRVQVVTD